MCLDSGPSVSHKSHSAGKPNRRIGRRLVTGLADPRHDQVEAASAEVLPIAIAVRRLMNCRK
jgi:hypothetical protein